MFLVDWAVKMRIRPPEFENSICDAKYHVSLFWKQIDRSDLIGDRSYDEVAAMDIVIWTPARWAGPMHAASLPSPLPAAAANFSGKRSGLVFEEYSFVLISSELLVQPDEGVSNLIMDRIGVNYRIYREEPGS
ncbi:hypothetical protein F511_14512 [Dorcoceras hygrometricum]|uniref:Uncharacterized protein n=1 Tax=Dorcoceras hygrometricum TaxID=472368 RepID=A0A2Z7AX40_9LAMI|nr:hypothetical protein F511_14512 [Dorcoceras hygrometricum]